MDLPLSRAAYMVQKVVKELANSKSEEEGDADTGRSEPLLHPNLTSESSPEIMSITPQQGQRESSQDNEESASVNVNDIPVVFVFQNNDCGDILSVEELQNILAVDGTESEVNTHDNVPEDNTLQQNLAEKINRVSVVKTCSAVASNGNIGGSVTEIEPLQSLSADNATPLSCQIQDGRASDNDFENVSQSVNNEVIDNQMQNIENADNAVAVTEPHHDVSLLTDNDAAQTQVLNGIEHEPCANNIESSSPRRKRRKVCQPKKWKQNKRKDRRQAGKSYVSVKGERKPAVSMRDVPCRDHCIRDCKMIRENERESMFARFWESSTLNSRRQYVSSLLDVAAKGSVRTSSNHSRRALTIQYHLVRDGERVPVCKKFFLATLGVSEKFVRCTLKNRNEAHITTNDKRGRHKPGIARPDESREIVREHINSFPRMPSHYNRANSKKEYLEDSLNLKTMYSLYVDKCRDDGITPEKEWLYRDCFNKDFNLAFHQPKKDLCDLCYKHQHMTDEERSRNLAEYERHVGMKDIARNHKTADKERAVQGKCQLAEFDLQAVLYCPHTNAKALFYKRRLAFYNLTVIDPVTKNVTCYTWDESVAKRGSNEIASCVYKYLVKQANGTEIVFYTDTCGGQNRNANISAMFLLSVKTLNIPEINHKYLTPGHTQMEVDSVHSMIEKKKKNVHRFDPCGWNTVIRLARKSPYEVEEMSQEDFFDFKKVQESLLKNKTVDENGEKVRWMNVVWFKYLKEEPNYIFFKYEMNEEFRKFSILGRKKTGLRMKQEQAVSLGRVYMEPLPISEGKLKDLLELCKQGIIRAPYHSFYRSLKSGNGCRNGGCDDEESDTAV